MTVTALRALDLQVRGTTFRRADELAMRRRMIKSPAEIDMMRQASAISVELMNAMFAEVAEGRTDGDVVAAGYAAACRLGAQPYEFAMASGPRTATCGGRASRVGTGAGHTPSATSFIRISTAALTATSTTSCGRRWSVASQRRTDRDPRGGIGCIHAACAAARPGTQRRMCIARAAASYVTRTRPRRRRRRPPAWAPGEPVDRRARVDWPRDRPRLGVAVVDARVGHRAGAGDDTGDRAARQPPRRGTMRYEETVLVTDGEPEIMTAGCKPRWW